jgi:hypothetical protein
MCSDQRSEDLRLFPLRLEKWNSMGPGWSKVVYSSESKTCLIQIPKTGSTTLSFALTNLGFSFETSPPCYRHEGIKFLEQKLNKGTHFIAVVRSPFAKYLSWFNHGLRYGKNAKMDWVTANRRKPSFKRDLAEQFHQWAIGRQSDSHIFQAEFVESEIGSGVSVHKLEDKGIQSALSEFCSRASISIPDMLERKNSPGQFLDVMLPKTAELIVSQSIKDFDLFSYSASIDPGKLLVST